MIAHQIRMDVSTIAAIAVAYDTRSRKKRWKKEQKVQIRTAGALLAEKKKELSKVNKKLAKYEQRDAKTAADAEVAARTAAAVKAAEEATALFQLRADASIAAAKKEAAAEVERKKTSDTMAHMTSLMETMISLQKESAENRKLLAENRNQLNKLIPIIHKRVVVE